MQGWRKSMEDAHITACDVVEGEVSLFAVFDGHGGCEVAKYIGRHFIIELKKN
jgi:serine/threonine protein phosphatase PrpC